MQSCRIVNVRPTDVRFGPFVSSLLLGSSLLVLVFTVATPVAHAQGGVTLTVPNQRVDYGWSAHFRAQVSGVPSGFPYTITWSSGFGTPGCPTPPLQSGPSDNFTTPPLTPSQTPATVPFCALLNAGSLGTALANATAIVNPALVAPVISVSQPTVNAGQSVTLTTTTPFSGGTPPYACQWLVWAPELNAFVVMGNPFACTATPPPTVPTGNLSTAGIWHFELQVTDNASLPMTVTSPIANITVSQATNTTTSPSSSSSSSTASSGTTTNGALAWELLVAFVGIGAAIFLYWYFSGGDEDDEKEGAANPPPKPPGPPPLSGKPPGDDLGLEPEYLPGQPPLEEDTFMEKLEAEIAATAPPEEPPGIPTPAAPPTPAVPIPPPAAAPKTAPPLEPPPPNPAAPDPCAEAEAAYLKALDVYLKQKRDWDAANEAMGYDKNTGRYKNSSLIDSNRLDTLEYVLGESRDLLRGYRAAYAKCRGITEDDLEAGELPPDMR